MIFWLRNRNTLEYIGIWEKVYNPDFNYIEFDTIKSQAGLNRFIVSVKELVEKTNVVTPVAQIRIVPCAKKFTSVALSFFERTGY